jgi:proteasome lid subunit RPN8/RPN11
VTIKLTAEQLDNIRRQSESAYPYECCGLLMGRLINSEKLVSEIYPAENRREEVARHNRFLIPPEVVRAAEKYALEKRLDILGFYHSHPNAEARPSQFDLDHAWPFYSYVIVSVRDQEAVDLTCWRMVDDRSRFEPEPMT